MEAGKTGMESALESAFAETRKAFRKAEESPVLAAGQNIAFSIYGLFYRQIALPLALGAKGPETGARAEAYRAWRKGGKPMPAPGPSLRTRLRSLASQILPFGYSALSLAWLALSRRDRTAIWTGDFLDPKTGADFRLGRLPSALAGAGIHYVEFIRENHLGFRAFWKNAVARKRPAIYYDAVTEFLGWLCPGPAIRGGDPDMLALYGLFRTELLRVARSIPLIRLAYRIAGVREVLAWEYSDRQAGMIHAARGSGLPVIGFMHGAGMQNYMVHEFIPEYTGRGALGPDVFGVWSEWWKRYYEGRSRLYGRIEVAGTLRKGKRPEAAPVGARPIRKVLWISEPLANVSESAPYLDALVAGFEVAIKKRPSTTDLFYNALLEARPEFRNLPTLDGDIFDAMRGYDAVAGTHSTAVIDACLMDKPFVLAWTPKWGDYFELGTGKDSDLLFAPDPAAMASALRNWEGADLAGICGRVRERFYGDPSMDGCAWVAGAIAAGRSRRSRPTAPAAPGKLRQRMEAA